LSVISGKVIQVVKKCGPSCPQKVVWDVFKKWSELSSKCALSCLYKVVRADLKSGPILY